MSTPALSNEDTRTWSLAGGLALAAHLAAAAMVLAWSRQPSPPIPEPVVLVELPPQAAPAPADATRQQADLPQPDSVPPRTEKPHLDIAPPPAPLPSEPVTLPPPPRRIASAQASAPADPLSVAATGAATGVGAAPGNDPRAKRQEADYFALVSAHLNRRKTYPAEARQARQQGVVTVRFTVDRSGGVSGASIKRSSGHDILDRATLDLLQRVAPLPPMPASMRRDNVTLSLPIDYSLRTS